MLLSNWFDQLLSGRIFGTSLIILSYCFSSKNTALLSFSLTLVFVHDFFLVFAPPLPAPPFFESCAFLEASLPLSLVATYYFLAIVLPM